MDAQRRIMQRNFCGRTRREFLWQAGAGFTGVALAGMLGEDGFLASQAKAADGVTQVEEPAGAEGTALHAESEERHLPLHVRRAEPHRHVRLQAGHGRHGQQDG